MKYHIGENGPGICRATKRPCPIGGEEVHFADKEEAQAAFEKSMGEEYGTLSTVSDEFAAERRLSSLTDEEFSIRITDSVRSISGGEEVLTRMISGENEDSPLSAVIGALHIYRRALHGDEEASRALQDNESVMRAALIGVKVFIKEDNESLRKLITLSH